MEEGSHGTARDSLGARRIYIRGKLGGMSRRELQRLLAERGANLAEEVDPSVNLVVLAESALEAPKPGDALAGPIREAVERGDAEVITETQLWQRLGLIEGQQDVHGQYTPAMLADLVGVPIAVVRRWLRLGLLTPARQVRRLAYFDFEEVAVGKRLAELGAAGLSPKAIARQVEALRRLWPNMERPLTELSVVAEGKRLLVRQEDRLVDPRGQWQFDFASAEAAEAEAASASASNEFGATLPAFGHTSPHATVDEMLEWAAELDDAGRLDQAIDVYRAVLAAAGPKPDICFELAELLYRQGELAAARERYYMAIELDEDYVEARSNLGCVLAELGELELAAAAFEGALVSHADYADAHYHLAGVLECLHRREAAIEHWRAFLAISPQSPWGDEAQRRLVDKPARPNL